MLMMMSGTTLSKTLPQMLPTTTSNAPAASSTFGVIGSPHCTRGLISALESRYFFTFSRTAAAFRLLVSEVSSALPVALGPSASPFFVEPFPFWHIAPVFRGAAKSRHSALAVGFGVVSTFANARRDQSVWGRFLGRRNLRGGGFAATPSPNLAVGVSEMAELEKVPVVHVDWLHQHLNDPNLKVLDASWYMPNDKRNPLQEYKESHIPGAIFFSIDEILDTTSEMPHMLPSEAAFSAAASALGLQNHDSIVVYDGKGIFSAARAWWMFRAFGHGKVWVLDGGLPQWLRQSYPVETAASSAALEKVVAASEAVKKTYGGEQVDSGVFKAQLQQNLVLSLDEVKQNILDKKYLLVDARSKARFDGSAPEPRKGVRGGHVPGSTCVPFTEVLTSTGILLPAEDLVGKFQAAGVSLDSPVATSCGTGVTACILALALHRLGRADIPVYDGSWTEWGLAPNVPVETSV